MKAKEFSDEGVTDSGEVSPAEEGSRKYGHKGARGSIRGKGKRSTKRRTHHRS